uniref:ATP synthase F0 subunit 6 n=1 Tax=Arctopsyche spinescens TaxID=2973067 RepID=UPI0022385807|nr:ATP synthase F0 subunit 6 [Arctopsyche spinescens]UYO79361.1 ATP synthase F0 subunit 6 [Arctopsyche spinescens]
MMNNLFSIFDPSSNLMSLSLNWMSSIYIVMIFPMIYWMIPNRSLMLLIKLFKILNNEIYTLLKNNSFKGISLTFMVLFMIIVLNNFMGLFPYIFTSSSHLVFNMSFSLPIWFTLMFFGWINKTENMFSHLIPSGTPPLLMPFMVLIETTSNMIRPLTLAVRLTANMIAGHLLISLLSNNGSMVPWYLYWLIISMELMLMLLESSVAIIQSYVFTILSTLYTSEI